MERGTICGYAILAFFFAGSTDVLADNTIYLITSPPDATAAPAGNNNNTIPISNTNTTTPGLNDTTVPPPIWNVTAPSGNDTDLSLKKKPPSKPSQRPPRPPSQGQQEEECVPPPDPEDVDYCRASLPNGHITSIYIMLLLFIILY